MKNGERKERGRQSGKGCGRARGGGGKGEGGRGKGEGEKWHGVWRVGGIGREEKKEAEVVKVREGGTRIAKLI